jgi:hypothetical protein
VEVDTAQTVAAIITALATGPVLWKVSEWFVSTYTSFGKARADRHKADQDEAAARRKADRDEVIEQYRLQAVYVAEQSRLREERLLGEIDTDRKLIDVLRQEKDKDRQLIDRLQDELGQARLHAQPINQAVLDSARRRIKEVAEKGGNAQETGGSS